MKHFPSSSPTVSFLLAIAVCTAVHSLDESFHRAEKPEEDKHFVSDPSAKVDGKREETILIAINVLIAAIQFHCCYLYACTII